MLLGIVVTGDVVPPAWVCRGAGVYETQEKIVVLAQIQRFTLRCAVISLGGEGDSVP